MPLCFIHLFPEFNCLALNTQLYTMDGRTYVSSPYYFVNFYPNNYIIFDSSLPASPPRHQICKMFENDTDEGSRFTTSAYL